MFLNEAGRRMLKVPRREKIENTLFSSFYHGNNFKPESTSPPASGRSNRFGAGKIDYSRATGARFLFPR